MTRSQQSGAKKLPRTGGRHERKANGGLVLTEKPTEPAPPPGVRSDSASDTIRDADPKPEEEKGDRK
jgi:hypothetical protein